MNATKQSPVFFSMLMRRLCFVFVALLVVLADRDAWGQWKNVAPGLLGKVAPYSAGVICFSNGQLWIGYNSLFLSLDSGITWTKMPLDLHGAKIRDIKFYDKNIGILAVEDGGIINGGVYITNDGGITWTHILAITYSWALDFCGSANDIIVCQNFGGQVYTSHDAGSIWHSIKLNDYGLDIHKLGNDSALAFFGNYASLKGHLYFSSDRGDTWTPKMDSVDIDSYSFAVDSTDHNKIYLVNEEFGAPKQDGSSEFFETRDGANSWQMIIKLPSGELFSSVALSTHAAYYQTSISTMPGGIFRLTRCDSIFRSINGPPANGDCRFLCVINDNILIACDLQGNVWKTINSGGDSLQPTHQLSSKTLDQSTDTIGGSVNIPITIDGLDGAEDIELVLHYDPELHYDSSFSPSNVKLDILGEDWPGRAKLHIRGATSGALLGYARFKVYPDSVKDKFHVTFDSISVPTAKSSCQYILPAAVTSTITPSSGCGIQTITRFMLDSTFPKFSIVPNPTNGDISISSTSELGAVSIEVYDMLGAKQSVSTTYIRKNSPIKITMPPSNGVYDIRVIYGNSSEDLRAVVSR